MAQPIGGGRSQRLAAYILILLALLGISTVVYVLLTGDDRAVYADEEFLDDPPLPTSSAPTLGFPESLRTYDASLNVFLDRFLRVTRAGQYGEFRKMWTQALDPVSADEFSRIWLLVREVRINQITRVPRPGAAGQFDYVVAGDVTLDDKVPEAKRRQVRRIRVTSENGRWALSPLTGSEPAPSSSPAQQPQLGSAG